MNKRHKTKRRKRDIYDKYRGILEISDLTEKQIDEVRKHLALLARTVCEHVWGRKFY
jgi:hypothetical protein